MGWECRVEAVTKPKKVKKSGITVKWLSLRGRERCCERRGRRGRLYDSARPLALRNVLGYRVRGVVKWTSGASSIPNTTTRCTSWGSVIGVHVRIIATRTGRSSIAVLRPFALLLSNAVHTRTGVYGIIDSPVRTFASVR